jgi:hypothetical protein
MISGNWSSAASKTNRQDATTDGDLTGMTTKTLERLASTFTVRDVMVPRYRMVCGQDADDCRRLLAEHDDFNLIPLVDDDRLVGYVERDLGSRQIGLHEDVISDSTSLLDLIDVFRSRTFSFVLAGDKIGGYVHFSDLNNRLVELSLYVLLQAVEHQLNGGIRPVNEMDLRAALGEDRARRLEGDLRRLSKADANLDIFSVMQLKDFMGLARLKRIINATDQEIDEVYRVRNSVSHAEKPLVTKHADVGKVAWVKDFCIAMIDPLDRCGVRRVESDADPESA